MIFSSSSGSRLFTRAALLDRGEQLAIMVLWAFFLFRLEVAGNPWAIFPLLTETTVLLFTLVRRPTQDLSLNPRDWALAITATWSVYLADPGAPLADALIPLGVGLWALGNAIQLWGKLVLRRSFGIAPANRGIKMTGPYRYVRHPIYAGYAVCHISALVLMFSPINLLVYGLCWTAQILRLRAEERFLAQDPRYLAYQAKVRWRLIPGLF